MRKRPCFDELDCSARIGRPYLEFELAGVPLRLLGERLHRLGAVEVGGPDDVSPVEDVEAQPRGADVRLLVAG